MQFLILWKNGTHTILEGKNITAALVNGKYGLSNLNDIAKYVVNGDINNHVFEHNEWRRRT